MNTTRPRPTRSTAARWVRTLLAATGALTIATLSTGCENGGSSTNDGPRTTLTRSFIDAGPAVEAYNARAERLPRLWARASVVVEGRDAEGSKLRERAEGHLQVIPPERFALSLGKLGETNLYFGSNEAVYWWFDMTDSGAKTAHFGRHALFSPDKIHELGLPLHPLDLVEVLGITPMPIDTGRVVARPGPTEDTVVVATPTRQGVRRATLDPTTGEPTKVELIGPGGRIMISAEMSRYTLVAGLDDGEAPLRFPGRVRVLTSGFDGEVRFSLHDPDRREIREVAFDASTLVEAYSIDAIYDLDGTEIDERLEAETATAPAE